MTSNSVILNTPAFDVTGLAKLYNAVKVESSFNFLICNYKVSLNE